jgi:hypothetical protein
MEVRTPLALLICAVAAGAAACGTAPAGTSIAGPAAPAGGTASTPQPSPAESPVQGPQTPPGAAGQVLGSATNAAGWTAVVTAEPDAVLQLTVTVRGPLTVLGGCVASLSAWAETDTGAPVPTPTLTPVMHCMAIALEIIPAGTSRSFTAELPEPDPPGSYVVRSTLDIQGPSAASVPAVTITT